MTEIEVISNVPAWIRVGGRTVGMTPLTVPVVYTETERPKVAIVAMADGYKSRTHVVEPRGEPKLPVHLILDPENTGRK
jgi:hypothetical protein